jgi:hypothetical protein
LTRHRCPRFTVFPHCPSLDGPFKVDQAILSRSSAFYRVLPTALPPSFPSGGASPGVLVPFSTMGSVGYIPRGSTLRYRPRPRFLTAIAGILPTDPFRAYFISEALLGFSLQGFPLETQRPRLIAESIPPAVPTVTTVPLPRVPRTASGRGRVDFRVSPRPSPFALKRPVRVSSGPFPSWVSSSLGVYLPPMMEGLSPHLSCAPCAQAPARVPDRTALQSLLHRRWSSPLSRLRPPFEVLRHRSRLAA